MSKVIGWLNVKSNKNFLENGKQMLKPQPFCSKPLRNRLKTLNKKT